MSIAETQESLLAASRIQVVAQQTAWVDLERRLLALGGQAVAMCYEEDMASLLDRGRQWFGVLRLKRGLPSRCHLNTACLWELRGHRRVSIVTGWALSGDGLWRQHSWGWWPLVRGGGRLIETTVPRESYYGFELSDAEAEEFAEQNQ